MCRPVEVKLQRYDLPSFGGAFEHVVSCLANGATVCAEVAEGEVPLSRPLLLLWWPPAIGLVNNEQAMARYRDARVEAVQFGQVLDELCANLVARDLVTQRVVRAISDLVRGFFDKEDLRLPPGAVRERWGSFSGGLMGGG